MIKFLSRAFFLQNLLAKFFALMPPSIGHNLGKYGALKKAFYLTSLDGVPGDYLEFGVFTGSSMSAAIEMSRCEIVPREKPVRFIGFDSFAGFGKLSDKEKDHPFFKDSFFETDAKSVQKRLSSLLSDPSRVTLIEGFFDATLKGKTPLNYGVEKAAVVMVDCDTYSGATLVFDFIKPALQEGTYLIIDDFFSYKGASKLGTYGAFLKFQSELRDWSFRRVFDYGYGGAVFVASK